MPGRGLRCDGLATVVGLVEGYSTSNERERPVTAVTEYRLCTVRVTDHCSYRLAATGSTLVFSPISKYATDALPMQYS
jgi:hypothetical protein